jgi:hypothetical protein
MMTRKNYRIAYNNNILNWSAVITANKYVWTKDYLGYISQENMKVKPIEQNTMNINVHVVYG